MITDGWLLIDLIDSRGKKEKNSDIFYDSLTIMNVGGDDDSGESDSELLGNVDYRPLQASELDISHVLLDDLHSTFIIFYSYHPRRLHGDVCRSMSVFIGFCRSLSVSFVSYFP